MTKKWCDQSGHGTLKSTVSQKWIDWINSFFTCWCKFRKAKSRFSDFWVCVVKNGHGLWVYLLHLKNEFMSLAHFLKADRDAHFLLDSYPTLWLLLDWYPTLWLLNAGSPPHLYFLTFFPDLLALCQTNLDDSIDSDNFSVMGYLPLIRKDSITHMYGLAIYVEEGLPFAQDLSLENCEDSHLCFWLALLCLVPYFFFLYRSPSSLLWFFILFHLT